MLGSKVSLTSASRKEITEGDLSTAVFNEKSSDLKYTPKFDNYDEALTAVNSNQWGKYDIESNDLKPIEKISTNVTITSVFDTVDDNSFYESIPDGGYGWMVVIAGFLTNFIMFGNATIWGVFSNALDRTILKDKVTTVELMGVGSTLIACLNMFTPLSPLLVRLGARLTMIIGSTLMSLGLILASFSTEIWHVYLTQGVLFGVGSSLAYMSIVATIPQWFTSRRGTAMGISSSGSGFGGLALSPMVSSLVDKFGLPWTYRIVGLFSFGVLMIASFLIRSRLPPGYDKRPISSPIRPAMLRDVNFMILVTGFVISLTANMIPFYYMPKFGASHSMNASQTANIVGVACATNAVGRLFLGFVADRLGRLNMYVLACTLAGLFCMVFWPFATTYESYMAFGVVFGFTGGIYYTLASPVVLAVVGSKNVGSGLSILFLASAISSVGPPIASAIEKATPMEHSYIGVQMFSGLLYITGSVICMCLKWKMTGSLFSKM